jgi:hypothetical protein
MLLLCSLACGAHGPTRLTVAVQQGPKEHVFHLRCSPAGDDLPAGAALCQALRLNTHLLLFQTSTSTCSGNPATSRSVGVQGLYAGKHVNISYTDCSDHGPRQIPLWFAHLPAPFTPVPKPIPPGLTPEARGTDRYIHP